MFQEIVHRDNAAGWLSWRYFEEDKRFELWIKDRDWNWGIVAKAYYYPTDAFLKICKALGQ